MKTIKRYYYEFLKERYVKCKNILGQDVYHVKEFEFSKDTYNGKIWMRYDNINDSDEKTLNALNKKFERVWDDYEEAMYYLHKIHKIYSIPLCFHILYIALSVLFILLAVIQGTSTGFSDIVPFCFLFGIALILLISYFINFIVFVLKNRNTRKSIKLAKKNKDKCTQKIKLILEKSPLFNDRSLDFLDEEIAPLYKSETYDKYKKVSIDGSKIKKTIDVEDNEVNDLDEEVVLINNPTENETVSSNQEDSSSEDNADEIVAVAENNIETENSENNDNIALTDEETNEEVLVAQPLNENPVNVEESTTEEVLDTNDIVEEETLNNIENLELDENNENTSEVLNENSIAENQEVDPNLVLENEDENINSEQVLNEENPNANDTSEDETLNSEDSLESNENNDDLESNPYKDAPGLDPNLPWDEDDEILGKDELNLNEENNLEEETNQENNKDVDDSSSSELDNENDDNQETSNEEPQEETSEEQNEDIENSIEI